MKLANSQSTCSKWHFGQNVQFFGQFLTNFCSNKQLFVVMINYFDNLMALVTLTLRLYEFGKLWFYGYGFGNSMTNYLNDYIVVLLTRIKA